MVKREGDVCAPCYYGGYHAAIVDVDDDAHRIRASLQADALAIDADEFAFSTPKMVGLLASKLDALLGGKTQRYLFTRWMFGVENGSAKSLSPGQVRALLDWLELDDTYTPSGAAKRQVMQCLIAAEKDAGQRELL